jgi:hypothetical protein
VVSKKVNRDGTVVGCDDSCSSMNRHAHDSPTPEANQRSHSDMME